MITTCPTPPSALVQRSGGGQCRPCTPSWHLFTLSVTALPPPHHPGSRILGSASKTRSIEVALVAPEGKSTGQNPIRRWASVAPGGPGHSAKNVPTFSFVENPILSGGRCVRRVGTESWPSSEPSGPVRATTRFVPVPEQLLPSCDRRHCRAGHLHFFESCGNTSGDKSGRAACRPEL